VGLSPWVNQKLVRARQREFEEAAQRHRKRRTHLQGERRGKSEARRATFIRLILRCRDLKNPNLDHTNRQRRVRE
jgi:hypothetical protein